MINVETGLRSFAKARVPSRSASNGMLPPSAVGLSTARAGTPPPPNTVRSHCRSFVRERDSTPADSCTPVPRSVLLDGGPRRFCALWPPDPRESRGCAGTAPGRHPPAAATRAPPRGRPPMAGAPTRRGDGSAPGTASSASARVCSRCRYRQWAASVRLGACQTFDSDWRALCSLQFSVYQSMFQTLSYLHFGVLALRITVVAFGCAF